jgi:hypothetical protein
VPKNDDIADHLIYFFKEDKLGTLANMHLAFCDKLGKKGPLNPKAHELSRLVSVAVDFAKHGKCVSKDEYKHIIVNDWPDYMDKYGEDVQKY